MPEPQPGETEKDFVSRCIPIVIKDGTAEDEKQAAAICYNMFRGKSIDMSVTLADATKIGAEISRANKQKIQAAHDALAEVGAACKEPPQREVIEFALMSDEKYTGDPNTPIAFGSAVKALGMTPEGVHVGGHLVLFGSPEQTDLSKEQDFFTSDTDYDLDPGQRKDVTVYFHHKQPLKTREGDYVMVRKKVGKGWVALDDVGVLIDAIVYNRDEYEKAIAEASTKYMGWSSGTAGHLIERIPQSNGSNWIKCWPIGSDATLTPTPAEPRIRVTSLKSLLTETTTQIIKENTMELTQEQLTQMMTSAVTEATKASVEASKQYVEAALKSLPTIQKGGFASAEVIHDEADNPFKSMGEQLHAVKQATLTQGRELAPRLKALNIKALGANELVGSEGGFLLEPAFVSQLLTPLHETGPFSSRANKLPIGPNSNGITVRAVNETSRVAGSRWGGIQGYRLNEAGTKTASAPEFRLVELRLKKYAVLCYATEELLQDTTALAGIIQQGCAEELDFMVNDDILNGLGAAGPLGILNSGALVSVSKESGQAAASLQSENIVKMWSRLHPRSKSNSVWFINPDVTPELYLLKFDVGTGGLPAFMGPGSLPNAPSGTLFGRPVVETEFNPTLGTVGDIVLADMSQYAMIDRDVQAASSIHVQFLTDQVAYRFVYRCDGQPKMASALTPYKGSNTLSPFVALATRA